MLSPSSVSSSLSQNLRDSALQSIKKNHPLFRPNFSSDDWIEDHGVWSLSEAAVTLAVAEYQTSIESHNDQLSAQVTRGKEQIQALEKELLGLVVWDKKKRGEITDAVGGLKIQLKQTKSETVQGDLNNQIRSLEEALKTMTTDRERKKTIEATIARLQQTERESLEKQIPMDQQITLAQDLAGALNNIRITPSSAPLRRASTTPSHTPWLATTRGKVATILFGLTAGTGLAWWNIHDQFSKGEEPVNLIERLWRGIGGTNDTKQAISDSTSDTNFYQQAQILFMRNQIEQVKQDILDEVSKNGSITGLNFRLKEKIKQAFHVDDRSVEIKENRGESGFPIFTIMVTQGRSGYIDSLGTSDIFNAIDNWITHELIANHFKSDMSTVMLAESYSNQPEQTRHMTIQDIARSSVEVTFGQKMRTNGYQLNTTDSGIIWDPASGRPSFKVVYHAGNIGTQQVLIKPFAQLP